jgi:hypothetical protein
MKYLRKFNENDSELSIEDWCKIFDIRHYEISGGLINVHDLVVMSYKELYKIPIKFGIIYGYFDCHENNLTSLENAPMEVKDAFNCNHNKLKTLEGSPRKVGDDFDCIDNILTTLKGSPIEVGEDFDCHYNKLTSLNGCPVKVGGDFSCASNKLKTLEGGPKKVGWNYNCNNNELITLKGSPIEVEHDFICVKNNLTTLEGCPEKIGAELYCNDNPIYEVFAVFGTFERYQESLDYKYLRGTNIVRGRFEKACEDAEIKMPDSIKGYKYIDL